MDDVRLPYGDSSRGNYERSLPSIDVREVLPYVRDTSHLKYLDNPAFHKYLSIEKTAVSPEDSDELIELGDELASEYMPRYMNAAAWAYAEVGLVDTTRSATERCQFVSKAERLWRSSIEREMLLGESKYSESFSEPEAAYRYAVSLAYAPLMKSVIVGNVTDFIRERTLDDTIAIASQVADEISYYRDNGDKSAASGFVGLAHELNALATLLYMDDARYVPFPSTARADTGYYHRTQSHDIIVVNQHWGAIKKIVPIEIKSRPSQKDRQRYKALLVRGKMHLTVSGADPSETVTIFNHMQQHSATPGEVASIEKIATELRGMLHLYSKGVVIGDVAVQSVLRFHVSDALHEAHPEIAPRK